MSDAEIMRSLATQLNEKQRELDRVRIEEREACISILSKILDGYLAIGDDHACVIVLRCKHALLERY